MKIFLKIRLCLSFGVVVPPSRNPESATVHFDNSGIFGLIE